MYSKLPIYIHQRQLDTLGEGRSTFCIYQAEFAESDPVFKEKGLPNYDLEISL